MLQFLMDSFHCHPHAGLMLLSNLNLCSIAISTLSFLFLSTGLLKIQIQLFLKMVLCNIPLKAPTIVHLSHIKMNHILGDKKCSGK